MLFHFRDKTPLHALDSETPQYMLFYLPDVCIHLSVLNCDGHRNNPWHVHVYWGDCIRINTFTIRRGGARLYITIEYK